MSEIGRAPLRAVVFDLWDTLVPFPLQTWHQMTQELADNLGIPLSRLVPIWDGEAHPRMIGPMEASLRRVARALDLSPDESLIARELSARTAFHAACLARPRPEAVPTLEELSRRGFKIGVISNCTSDVPPVWPASPLAGVVDAAVFSSEVGLTKPAPAIYAIALTQLRIAATECMYVGDGAGEELNGALAVGMRPVHLRYPGIPEQRLWSGEAITTLDEVLVLAGHAAD